MGRINLIAGLAAILFASSTSAQTRFNPNDWKGPRRGPLNEVLLLGSPHIRSLPPNFQRDALIPLIDRLRKWAPRAIAVEAMSGTLCDQLRPYPRHQETVKTYCSDTAQARLATGLDVPAASFAADRLLANWPETPTPAQRRRLAALFLAAGEQGSALVQWLRLIEAERRSEGTLSAALVAHLETLRAQQSEIMLIAAPLAAQLGLERLHSMDDQSPGGPIADEKAYAAAITLAWNNEASKRRGVKEDKLNRQMVDGEGVLTVYRQYNSPRFGKIVYDSDLGAALEEPSPERYGRAYVGYWETRNLRRAANIRDMLAATPGVRALIIVGASHKPYLDAYLDMMHDVHLADTTALLK